MKILPKSKYTYTKFPISKLGENGEEIVFEGVIEITDEELEKLKNRTYCFSGDLKSIVPVEENEMLTLEKRKEKLIIISEINRLKKHLDKNWRWRKERNECEQKEILLKMRTDTTEEEDVLIQERAEIVARINLLEDVI